MKHFKKIDLYVTIIFVLVMMSCSTERKQIDSKPVFYPTNILNYIGTPSAPSDRSSLAFSDQGAWFAYGFSDEQKAGFSGPLLLTQGQGEWSSKALSQLELLNIQSGEMLDYQACTISQKSYNSHLEQCFKNDFLSITQTLFYVSPHTALITTQIKNLSDKTLHLQPAWKGAVFPMGFQMTKEGNRIVLTSSGSTAKGIIQSYDIPLASTSITDTLYSIVLKDMEIESGETQLLTLTHTFIFPEYDLQKEQQQIDLIIKTPLAFLQKRKQEKVKELQILNSKIDSNWQDTIYENLMAKTVLTLQNNTRIAAGELKHPGLFPSYHYKWFLGFWAWDSWKHAVALARYQPNLAKDQIRAMYDYQLKNGYIPDCIYRDTTLEKHNFRNTKPPLSAWAVWEVYKQDKDAEFLKEMYPKILKQHHWWYQYRDYDKDSLCEYGSMDGTLIAAKWESGMDNAVRFDESKILGDAKNGFSLNQESVDLNAYLYAEKSYLMKIAEVLDSAKDVEALKAEAKSLKLKIQSQFFDKETAWFYDTSIDGETFIDVMGCEGWIPLWANVATAKQAEAIKDNMMNPDFFNTKVPFQTLSASHPKFKPDRGYWRGPNWLDQAYFGVRGLHNYGYHTEAYSATYKLIHQADGVLTKGISIRENYNPITGEGLESQSFSWSAAHYLLLLINE